MQALAMRSDEKLQCAMSFRRQMLIALHPYSHIKMRFFFPSQFGDVFGFSIAIPRAEWIHFISLNFLLGNNLRISQVLSTVRRRYCLTPITGSD